MPQSDPANYDYLAVVSEWSSSTPRGGLVGNAYPLVNLSTNEVVTKPLDDFPNAGAVFLMTRGILSSWDFVRVRPRRNERYKNQHDRDCFYIPARPPEICEAPEDLDDVAAVLDHPSFDPASPGKPLLNPKHNVTPLFFVRRGSAHYGPLVRADVHLSPMDDVQRIDWRPARDDGIAYEFTPDDLAKAGLKLAEYSHPDESLNRVVGSSITFALGPVRKATSGRPIDGLTEAALIEWYAQHSPSVELPPGVLAALKAGFRAPEMDPVIRSERLRKVEKVMLGHAAFHDQRERFSRQYVESEDGQKRLRELFEQAVARKATEIQAEVDAREGALGARRKELEVKLADAEREHQDQLNALLRERDALQERVGELRSSREEVQTKLSEDLRLLAAKASEQLPLIAALSLARPGVVVSPQAVPADGVPQARVKHEFRPVAPTSEPKPVQGEAKLVEDLHADLARQGLHFARDFVANVYACLKAEALNLIIGPPGYGKSMLVSGLARAMGHADAFLRIAVQRSWSEDRYLLGFFDSFNGRYDPGATGLVGRMLQADADWKQKRGGVYVVLLDEFNLAAPEYYFSQLLQLLPSDEAAREVSLYDAGRAGGDGFPPRVTLHPNLRFWGTINYDETTERLSPRTLDRTGMIFLGDADVKPTIEDASPPMAGVSAADPFDKYLRGVEDCPDERWELVVPVIDFLRSPDPTLGPRLEVSPRVRRAIKRYLANSADVLPARTAVDFVVQQRILPVVRGRGEEYFARMTRLERLLGEAKLTRSAAHVAEAVRRSAQQFGEIDFLSY